MTTQNPSRVCGYIAPPRPGPDHRPTSEPGWSFVRGPNYLALMKRFFSFQTADELRSRIKSYLENQTQPEFSDVWIVRKAADFHPAMAKFTIAFLQHERLHGRLSA
jgi:hypothetical protein